MLQVRGEASPSQPDAARTGAARALALEPSHHAQRSGTLFGVRRYRLAGGRSRDVAAVLTRTPTRTCL